MQMAWIPSELQQKLTPAMACHGPRLKVQMPVLLPVLLQMQLQTMMWSSKAVCTANLGCCAPCTYTMPSFVFDPGMDQRCTT